MASKKSPYGVEVHVNSEPPYVFHKLFPDVNTARKCFDAVWGCCHDMDQHGIYEVRLWNYSIGRVIMKYEVGQPLYDGMAPSGDPV